MQVHFPDFNAVGGRTVTLSLCLDDLSGRRICAAHGRADRDRHCAYADQIDQGVEHRTERTYDPDFEIGGFADYGYFSAGVLLGVWELYSIYFAGQPDVADDAYTDVDRLYAGADRIGHHDLARNIPFFRQCL